MKSFIVFIAVGNNEVTFTYDNDLFFFDNDNTTLLTTDSHKIYNKNEIETSNSMNFYIEYNKIEEHIFIKFDLFNLGRIHIYKKNERIIVFNNFDYLKNTVKTKVDFIWLTSIFNKYYTDINLQKYDSLAKNVYSLFGDVSINCKTGAINQFVDEKEKIFFHKENNIEVLPRILYEKYLIEGIKKQCSGKNYVLLLSGGVDSALLAGVLRKQNIEFEAWTYGYETEILQDDKIYSKKVCDFLGIEQRYFLLPNEDIPCTPEDWIRLVEIVQTPFCSLEQIFKFYVFMKAKKEGKEILLGSGADEFQGGYILEYLESMGDSSTKNFAGFLQRYKQELDEFLFFNKLSNIKNNFNRFEYPFFQNDRLVLQEQIIPAKEIYESFIKNCLQRMITIVLHNDSALCQSIGVKLHYPFLDYNLLNLSTNILPHYYIDKIVDKKILREVAEKFLPTEITYRKKSGFYLNKQDIKKATKKYYELLRYNDSYLIEYVFGQSKLFQKVFDKDNFFKNLEEIGKNQEYEKSEQLLQIVNFGILDIFFNKTSKDNKELAFPRKFLEI